MAKSESHKGMVDIKYAGPSGLLCVGEFDLRE